MPGAAKEPPQEFPTTWWTLIEQALADGTTVRTTALHELVLRYAPPLRAHLLLCKRLDAELADELLQSFVTEKIVAQYLLRHADRGKGQFRSLLVRSLENYYADWGRARAVQPLTAMTAVLDEIAAEGDVEDAFEIAWARQMLDEVLAAMKAECDASGQADIWGVFECRLLAPVRERCEPLPYEDVCRRFAFSSPEHASNALVTAKRKFQRAFQRVAARYQHDGEQAEDVLRELIGVLSRAGPLEWKQIPEYLPAAAGAVRSSDELDDSQPSLVARLLELGPHADELWQPNDLVGLMRHQLSQRLADLHLAPDVGSRAAASGQTSAAPVVTLADLFAHSAPPLDLLDAVKRYGRKHAHREDAMLPDEIASALYFASIAAALVCHRARITKADDELLRWSFERLLRAEWIEPPLRGLFEQGLVRLGDGGDAA